jgi:tetratricopeptide (TPR) repeat protein
MKRDAKFWYSMVVFQLLFGLLVFAFTREYYRHEAVGVTSGSLTLQQRSSDWAGGIGASEFAWLGSQTSNNLPTEDPVEISRRADEYFTNRQYGQAAAMYERLLAFNPDDGEIHNNLGLTLHYLGRSAEALDRLEEGAAVDPQNQRIWLTLGYVNSALGNTGQAREALTNAMQTGSDESIRQSAKEMLEALP